MYIHPLKVWDRYSPQMFLPHLVSGHEWAPLFSSSEAAAVSSGARGFRAPRREAGSSRHGTAYMPG